MSVVSLSGSRFVCVILIHVTLYYFILLALLPHIHLTNVSLCYDFKLCLIRHMYIITSDKFMVRLFIIISKQN